MDTEVVKAELTKVLVVAEEIFGNDNQLKITTKYKVEEHGIEADLEVNKLMYESLKIIFCWITYNQFVNAYAGKEYGILQAQKWDQQLLKIQNNAYWAVLGAMAIVFYT
jgi:SecD/SecF fusion protein